MVLLDTNVVSELRKIGDGKADERVATKTGAEEVLEALYQLMIQRGTPTYLRSDNGPEFIAELLQSWLKKVGVEPIHILPGLPWENGYNERPGGCLEGLPPIVLVTEPPVTCVDPT